MSGCFDILHGGHVEFLRAARSLGDQLVVCVPTDAVITHHKHRRPALTLEHRTELLKALRFVDDVVVGSDPDLGLNFKSEFERIRPSILAVTTDDRFEAEKRRLCDDVGALYVQLSKTLDYDPISSTQLHKYLSAPLRAPLRVDFAGGWLDVPKLSRPGAFVVNCAICPLVSLTEWPYHIGGGLGGSAAFKLLSGQDSLQEELKSGVGWQDPAVIQETGLCVWQSGPQPVLEFKANYNFLVGRMAIFWTGKPHVTADLVNTPRNYSLIHHASKLAASAVRDKDYTLLLRAVHRTYQAQIEEGMEPLPNCGAAAMKYLGSGWGGYALALFNGGRDSSCIPIEPYARTSS